MTFDLAAHRLTHATVVGVSNKQLIIDFVQDTLIPFDLILIDGRDVVNS